MKKTRLTSLDLAKGLGILMITYGHITDIGNPVDAWMSMFKITVFYIISGFLIARGNRVRALSCKQYAKKLFRSLIVPYIAFSFIGLLFRTVMLYLRHSKGQTELLKTYLYETITLRGHSTLWFLPTLFFGSLLLFWVLKHKNKVTVFLSFTVPLIFGHFVPYWLTLLSEHTSETRFLLISCPVLTIAKSILAFWFVAVGYVSFRLLQLLKGELLRFTVGLLLSLLTIYLSTFTDNIDFNSIRLGTHPTLFYIGGISGSIGAILVFEYLSKFFSFPVLKFFGQNSLILMSIQRLFYLINIGSAGWRAVAKAPDNLCIRYYFDCLAVLGIVLLISYPIIEYINCYLPMIIGKKKALTA